MEERIMLLEERVKKLENELALVLRHLNLPDKLEKTSERQDEEAALVRAYEEEVGSDEYPVKIYRLRARLGWERERFDRLVESMAEQGYILLHQTDVSSLSLKQIDDSYVSEDGDLFSEISKI